MYTIDKIHDYHACDRCNGRPITKHYQNIHGDLHSEDAPAYKRMTCVPESDYHEFIVKWMKRGKLHRIGKPAVIHSTTINDKLVETIIEWREYGLHHNSHGPATITTDYVTGEVQNQWWINGHRYRDVLDWLKVCKLNKADKVAIKLTYM